MNFSPSDVPDRQRWLGNRSLGVDPQHPLSAQWRTYFAAFHTSTAELAAIATRAKPRFLVLYRQVFHEVSEGEMLHEVRQHYSGAVVSAHDLDLY